MIFYGRWNIIIILPATLVTDAQVSFLPSNAMSQTAGVLIAGTPRTPAGKPIKVRTEEEYAIPEKKYGMVYKDKG